MARHDVKVLVSDLVAERPSRSRFFERLGIEYCCGGRRPLDEVCGEKGLDARTLLDTLEAAESTGGVGGDERDWSRAPIEELVRDITTVHHAYLRRELPRLSALADHVAEGHGEEEPRLLEVRDTLEELRGELEPHLDLEEEVVFPDVLTLLEEGGESDRSATASAAEARSRLRGVVGNLEHEHRSTAHQLQRIGELTDRFQPPEWACNGMRAFYDGLSELEANIHEHVHKENNILFPAVERLVEGQR